MQVEMGKLPQAKAEADGKAPEEVYPKGKGTTCHFHLVLKN